MLSTVCMIIILVPLVNCVRTGSANIFYFVSYKNEAGLLCNIMINGLKGLINISLSIIEKTSYFMCINARRVNNDPY